MTTPVGPGGTPESKRPDENSENMKRVSKQMEKVWTQVTSSPKAPPKKHTYTLGMAKETEITSLKVAEKIRSKL